ncbi:MAG: integrase, partial [Nitrosospira multiformis]|nr:integrase [Nitrosospira multiformis]
MKLLLGCIFSVSIKYVYQRGNTYYYQRKIPKDLLHRYHGATHVKVNLRTSEPALIAKRVRELNRQYESTWAALRGNPELKPYSVREAAVKLLAEYGLKPQPADNDEHAFDRLVGVFEGKHEAYAQGDEELYHSA